MVKPETTKMLHKWELFKATNEHDKNVFILNLKYEGGESVTITLTPKNAEKLRDCLSDGLSWGKAP